MALSKCSAGLSKEESTAELIAIKATIKYHKEAVEQHEKGLRANEYLLELIEKDL